MYRFIGFGAGAAGVGVMSMAFFGTGVAAADAYAGQTYSDVSSALSKASMKAVVAGTVGDSLPQSDCIVERSQKAAWLKGNNFSPVTDTVLVYLNCNAKLATAATPGNSLASPEGRAEKAAEDQQAAEEAQKAANQAAAQQSEQNTFLAPGGA